MSELCDTLVQVSGCAHSKKGMSLIGVALQEKILIISNVILGNLLIYKGQNADRAGSKEPGKS